MIVPQARLLFWVALVALPFSVLGAVYPEAGPWALCLIVGLLLVVIVDAGRAARVLDGFEVRLPAVVRMSQDRPALIQVVVQPPQPRPDRVLLGLALPQGLTSPREDCLLALRDAPEGAAFDWPCQPQRRGRFRIERAYLEAASPFGFWAVRRSVPVACEARVYPNLLTERKGLAALFLRRGAVGLHAQRQLGKGRDFEKLREYVPGDSFDEIHWKATARRGHPITKVFQIERTQEVYLVIDTSRLSGRRVSSVLADDQGGSAGARSSPGSPWAESTPAPATILERFLVSALILAQAAEQQGDLFGLLTFADQVQTFLRARNGKAHYSACRDALYTLEARPCTPDFDEIAFFIRTRLRRRALLIFFTSLEDPVLAEAFVHNMTLIAGQHLVLVNMIQPPGASPLFTRADVATTDDLYRHLGGHLQWHGLRELEKVLQRRGVRFSLVDNEHLATEAVAQYLSVKQRQLL